MKHQRSLISIALATIMLLSVCAVSASTSVSAATPPGKPIPAGTGPSACFIQGTLNMYVFVKGYDGALWYRIFTFKTESWVGGWHSLGGKLSGSPVAVSRGSGILDVYITDPTGTIYEKYTTDSGSTWHGYYKIDSGAKAGTGPGASAWSGREDVFWIDTSGNLWQKSWISGQGWKTKSSLGKPSTGGLTSGPAAVSRAPGLIDVHARGANGADYYRSYSSGWKGWATLGGSIKAGTGPGISIYHPTTQNSARIDVFITATDGTVRQRTWTTTKGWTTTWANLGGTATSTPTVGTKQGIFAMELFVRVTNGNVCAKEYYASNGVDQWHGWLCGMQGPPCASNCY